MKNIYKSAAVVTGLGALMLTSCTKQIDDAYLNPNANVKQPIELLLPNVIQNMAVSNTANGSLYGTQNDGQYVGRYVQFWATNTSLNQYDMMGQTTTNNTSATSDIGGSQWAMHYYGMGQNITRIIEWGTEEKKWDYVGVAHAIRAFSWLAVTDMHGEVILRDAFNTSKLVFNYDSQADVYEEVKRNAHLALDFLERSGDGVSEPNLAAGAQFFSLKGNRDKWKKFAHSILARVFHRVTNKAGVYNADSVIYHASRGITSVSDNAYVLFANINNETRSYYGPSRGNIGAFRQTRFIADLMSGVNPAFPGVADPRAWYILRENLNGTFKGIRPAKGSPDGLAANDVPPNFWGGTGTTGSDANARYVWKDAMPWPVIAAPEMHFLMAEAYFRKNQKDDARTAYRNGISASIDMLNTDFVVNVPAPRVIDAAAKAAFLNDPLVVPSAANLTIGHIMLQKYIALFGYGFMEVWADLRRFHYTDIDPVTSAQVFTNFTPPTGNDLFVNNQGQWIYRVRPRFNSEFLYNIDALNLIGATALNYHTKEQWFSQP